MTDWTQWRREDIARTKAWLFEAPEPILAEAMADERRTARLTAMRTGEFDGNHSLSCDCRRCVREQFDPADGAE